MSGSVFSSSAFAAFAAAIRQRESTDNYGSVNKYGYMGAYQMQEPALKDAGFQDAHGNWTALAKSLGVTSDATFLSTPSAQDAAFQNYTEKNFEYLHNYWSYIGKTVGGILITESGLLAGAHLTGQRSVKEFLSSGGTIDRRDKNKVLTSQYMHQFAGYNFTFPNTSSGFSPAVNTPPGGANQPGTASEIRHLQGTPAERARHHARQARAHAAMAHMHDHMRLHQGKTRNPRNSPEAGPALRPSGWPGHPAPRLRKLWRQTRGRSRAGH